MNRSIVLPDRLRLEEDAAFSTPVPSKTEEPEASPSHVDQEAQPNTAENGSYSQFSARMLPALTSEQLKLRNTLLFAHEQQGVRSVLITGANEGAGATSVAASLALGLSLDPQKEILLVDANVQRPQLHKLFNLKMSEGVTAASENGANFLDMAVVVGAPNMHVMASINSNRRGTFDIRRIIAVLPALHEAFNFVIVDAPPLSLHADVLMLSLHLNSVILVAEAERTRIQEVQKTAQELQRAKANLLGVVLNRQKDRVPPTIKRFL